MKLVCPECGATMSLAVALTDTKAREFASIAMQMPAPLADSLLSYLSLFRPAQKALTWSRATNLLIDLQEPIQEGKLRRNGRVWPAPVSAWKAGFETVLARRDKLQLPLKNHAYLFEVIAGDANKIEAAAETKREETRRNQPRTREASLIIDKPPAAPTNLLGALPADMQAKMRQELKKSVK